MDYKSLLFTKRNFHFRLLSNTKVIDGYLGASGLSSPQWGSDKRCKKGSHAIGAEVGLHDDYGLTNFEKIYVTPEVTARPKVWFYLASILNIRLYCSEYHNNDENGGTSKLEGDLHKNWPYVVRPFDTMAMIQEDQM